MKRWGVLVLVKLCVLLSYIFVELSELELSDYVIVKPLEEFTNIGHIQTHVVI